jgi:ABC-2 type transport system permease protein
MNADNAPARATRRASITCGVGAVFRHEFRQFAYSPLTYIFQFGFLGALAACIFLVADFYATDEATIRLLLVFLPWIGLGLVPALAMRAWSEGSGDRSIELTLTLPIPLVAVVIGKFLAGHVVLLITLTFTTPFVATLYYLGQPDPGVIAAGYLSVALLLGAYYGFCLFAAALIREPIGAFIVGVAGLSAFALFGWDTLGRLVAARLPLVVIDSLTLLSPIPWAEALGRGFIAPAGILYFALAATMTLAGTALAVDARRRGRVPGSALARGAVLALGFMVALAVVVRLAAQEQIGIDLTSEREFTIHSGTKEVLARLPSDVQVTLYWSADQANVPAAIKTHALRVKDMLTSLAGHSHGRLSLKVVDPMPDGAAELAALRDGIQRIPMSSGDFFYFGAVFRHGDRAGRIPYLDIRRDRLAEYDIAVALQGLSRPRTPKVGILSPLLPPAAARENPPGLSFLAEIKRAYDVALIPFFAETLPDGLDTVIAIDATVLKSEMLYALDQFVMKGGSLIVMLDPFVRSNHASNMISPQPSEEVNDISDLLLAYGIRYVGHVVGDLSLASPVADESQRRMTYPYWLRANTQVLSTTHPVTASLNEVFFVEPGELVLTDKQHSAALVTTTEQSGAQPRIRFADRPPQELAATFSSDGQQRTLAAVVHGPFASAFAKPPANTPTQGHLVRSSRAGLAFAIADVDWLFDSYSSQTIEIGGQPIVRPLNDNLTFLLNLIEFATGNPALIAMRSRGQLQRSFTRVAALFKNVERQYHEEESALTRQIVEVEGRLAQIAKEVDIATLEQMPDYLKQEIRRVQEGLLLLRQKLRDVRRHIREEVDRLGRIVIIVNLIAGPILVVAFAGIVAWSRRRAHRTPS